MSDGRSKIELASYKGKRLNPAVKVLLALILLGALVFGGLLGLVLSGSHDAVQGNPQVRVVLGCQVKPWGPSVLLQDRLDKALEYLEDHPGMTVVVSGGQGPEEPTSEAEAMAGYLVQKGVAPEQIIQEALSHLSKHDLQRQAFEGGGGGPWGRRAHRVQRLPPHTGQNAGRTGGV